MIGRDRGAPAGQAGRPAGPAGPPGPDTDAVGAALRWRAVLGTIVAAAVTVLDLAMTSTALGDIQAGVGAPLSRGALLISAYATAELVTLALSAWLTRSIAPRPYLAGLIGVFVLGGLLAASAGSFEVLLVARVVQGAASGAIMPFAYYAIVVLLGAKEHPRAIAAFSFTVTASYVLAPILCLTLAEWFSWRALYLVAAPAGAVALALAWAGLAQMPTPSAEQSRRVSVLSLLAAVLGLFCTQFVLDSVGVGGAAPLLWVAGVGAVVLLAGFVINELRTRAPLVDLRLLRRVPFLVACAFNVVAGAAVYGSLFLIPFYLTSYGYSVPDIGLVTLYGGVLQLGVAVGLPLLLRRVQVYLVSLVGAGAFAVGAVLPLLAAGPPPYALVVAALMARSVGSGLLLASLGLMATRSLRAEQASSGSLLFNMARSLGGSVGAAACATLLVAREAARTTGGAVDGAARVGALADVLGLAAAVLAGLVVAFGVGWLRRRRRTVAAGGRGDGATG